jgi:type I restriction enzyme S subunit
VTPEQFMAAFGAIAEAPGGIEKLRELSLSLAFRGRLTVRCEESGITVLQAAADEMARRVTKWQSRDSKSVPPTGEQAPFEIPPHWVWACGEDVFRFITSGSRGWAKYYSHEGPIFIRIGNLDYMTTKLDLSSIQRVTPPNDKEAERTRVFAGDILVSITGDPGMIGVVPDTLGPAHMSQHVALARPCQAFSPEFLGRYLTSPTAREQFFGAQRGIKNSLGLDDIRRLHIPVPPLAEQKRIVAKVDELMAMLDDLKQRQEKKRTAAIHVSKASLDSLVNAEDPDQLACAWERVSKHFGVVATHASMLRAAIISLAVSGRMIQCSHGQSEEDGYGKYMRASELLHRMMDEGTIRRRALMPLAVGGGPIPLPLHWTWARLDHLITLVEYGTSQKADDNTDGYPVLRMGDICEGEIDFSDLKYVPKTTEGVQELLLDPSDLLFNRTNSYEHVGKMGIYRGRPKMMTFASYLIRLRVLSDFCDPEFLNAYFQSSLCRKSQIEPEITQQTNQANFNGTKLRSVLVPLPPLAEQTEIVCKMNSLLACVEQISHLQKSTAFQSDILARQLLMLGA